MFCSNLSFVKFLFFHQPLQTLLFLELSNCTSFQLFCFCNTYLPRKSYTSDTLSSCKKIKNNQLIASGSYKLVCSRQKIIIINNKSMLKRGIRIYEQPFLLCTKMRWFFCHYSIKSKLSALCLIEM